LRRFRFRSLLVWGGLLLFTTGFFLRGQDGNTPWQFAARVQVLPALLRWGATILFFAGTALLAGRFYCSLLCPLGLFQEAVHGLGGRALPGYRPCRILRYLVLAAAILSMAAGSLGLLNLLDPFATFGRGVTQILKPLLVAVNNVPASISGEPSPILHHLPAAPVTASAFLWTSLFFLALAAWAITRGRPFCDTLCPVGTFLGLFSSSPLLSVRFDTNACSGCGRCERVCPTGCLSSGEMRIERDRCILCLSCLGACKTGALRLGMPSAGEGLQRRGLIRTVLGAAAALAFSGIQSRVEISARSEALPLAVLPVSPPGSGSHDHFRRKCIACSSCVSACPAGIIRPTLSAWGASGLFQPRLDYRYGYCQYECNACTGTCPTGAIEPLSVEAKQRVQIGRARFDSNACIVVKRGTACGACAEHCPTQAAHMVPYRDGLSIPEVDCALCIGCGACQFACPALPKAMTVEGLRHHGTAKRPEDAGEGAVFDPIEEFPF
jgi:ferredoxin